MTAADVMEATGCTYRQLSTWCDNRLIPGHGPRPGSGNPREFTRAQVLFVRRMVLLGDAGIPPSAASYLLRRSIQTPDGIVVTATPHVRITVADRFPAVLDESA